MISNLGFTMEELMFPENDRFQFLFNIQTESFINQCDCNLTSVCTSTANITENDDTDDWFTTQQLNSVYKSMRDTNIDTNNDRILSFLTNTCESNCIDQMISLIEQDKKAYLALSSNISINIVQDHNEASSDLSEPGSLNSIADEKLQLPIASITPRTPSRSYIRSKSASALCFGIQASTSTTSSTISDMNMNSFEFGEIPTINRDSISSKDFRHQYQQYHSTGFLEESPSMMHRRRRKRTIFTAADIDHLKQAFAQNPKPTQQDIAILSDHLGHDSYVIRVWFYNKRQASKKQC